MGVVHALHNQLATNPRAPPKGPKRTSRRNRIIQFSIAKMFFSQNNKLKQLFIITALRRKMERFNTGVYRVCRLNTLYTHTQGVSRLNSRSSKSTEPSVDILDTTCTSVPVPACIYSISHLPFKQSHFHRLFHYQKDMNSCCSCCRSRSRSRSRRRR